MWWAIAMFASNMNSSMSLFASRCLCTWYPFGKPVSLSRSNWSLTWSRRKAPFSKRLRRRHRANLWSWLTWAEICSTVAPSEIGGSSLGFHCLFGFSIMSWACSYAILTRERIIPLPFHSSKISPFSDICQTMEKVKRSSPGFKLHSSSHKRRGSMGITFCTMYVDVALSMATSSNAVPLRTKKLTSAMCTPTSKRPSWIFLQWTASSRSLAVRGSIVKTQSSRKSLLYSNSFSGIFQGVSWGKHARASSEKGPESIPYSKRIPSVSGSISPASPRLRAIEPTARNESLEEVSGQLTIRATSRVFSKSRGLSKNPGGHWSRGMRILGSRLSAGEKQPSGHSLGWGKGFKLPLATRECFFSIM